MGYSRDFTGSFSFSRPLTVKEKEYLIKLSRTRQNIKNKPGYWVHWIPNEDGTELKWDGGEKFYKYVEWLEYLIKNYFSKRGVELNGIVEWRGEDLDDTGEIKVVNNVIEVNKNPR